jgi:hypothetical protein
MNLENTTSLTLRPRILQRRPGALIGAAGWLPCSAVFAVRFHGLALVVIGVLDLAVIIGAIGAVRRSYRRTSLMLGPDGLTWAGPFRDRPVFASSDPGRVVEAEVHWLRTSARRTHIWLLINADGRAEVGLNADVWDRSELEDLRHRLSIPREVITETLSGKELRTRLPGSVPWPVLHPIALTYLLIAIIITVVLLAQRL